MRLLVLLFGHQVPQVGPRLRAAGAWASGYVIAPVAGTDAQADFGTLQLISIVPRARRDIFGSIASIKNYVDAARTLFRTGADYEVIVAIGMYETAIAAWIIRLLHRRKLIMELTVVPSKIVRYRSPGNSFLRQVEARWLKFCTELLLSRADRIKLIFPGQLATKSLCLGSVPSTAFPDFVPISSIEPALEGNYLLLIGTPLYLKGADLAIAAFQQVQREFPGERLLVVGSSQGFPALQAMLNPGDCIELRDFVSAPKAISLIRGARIVLVPSRTDAMPRVAVEAMAAAKPIIAARVDGMAVYLRDDVNCLLFEPEDIKDLTSKLRRLLTDSALRECLGHQARHDAVAEFGEEGFTRRYQAMFEATLAGGKLSSSGGNNKLDC